ncbi:hypothetical protein WUBG_09069 [Wuchereria bancrofti]|uniref:Uncharacterized protein n=1 Tax=Wuchereria bancrofti TaxID=6293 RepID=J9EC63_WUCBA|nr:hypothetical protein WUBG_09069 [Wuchereria bancrofti]
MLQKKSTTIKIPIFHSFWGNTERSIEEFAHGCIKQRTSTFIRHDEEIHRHIHNDRKRDSYQLHDALVPGGETCADRFDSSSSNLTAAVFAQESVQLQQQFSGALE